MNDNRISKVLPLNDSRMKIKTLKYYLIPAFWVVVMFLMIGQDVLTSNLRETNFYFTESFIFRTKWLLYIPISFLVFWLAEKFPLQKPNLIKNAVIHFCISLIVSILAVFVYSYLIYFLWNTFLGKIAFQPILQKNIAVSFFNEFVNYWLLLATDFAINIYRNFQESKIEKANLEKQLSEARLGFLKMQLQPHFLFNAHHNIVGLMQKGDTEKATQMLMKLSDLLRLSLKENNDDLVPLRNETQLLSLYLGILKIRFESRLDYKILITSDLENAYVPPMLLQPIVENAVKYGIEPFSKQGFIEISANKIDDKLELSVKDNGIDNQSFTNFNWGIGLSNTKERLKNLYENDFKFEILSNQPENGILVKIIIPLMK